METEETATGARPRHGRSAGVAAAADGPDRTPKVAAGLGGAGIDAPRPLADDYTWLYGWMLLALTYVGFAVSMYALLLSKWMPLTGNKILDWIARDEYYCYLLPATLPVTVYVVLWNWMSMKFFRHN